MDMLLRWHWVSIFFHIYFCAPVYSSNENYFISPTYRPDDAPRTYLVGSTLNVSWHTNLTRYSIQLWQEYPDHSGAQPSATTVYNQSGSDPEITSFNWTVTPYELDLDLSHSFYFWINEKIPSAYFNIYNSSTTATTTGSSQPATSQTASSSRSTSPSAALTVTATPNTSSSNSTSLAIGLGVGLGVGLPLAILCGVCMGFRMRRRQDHIDTYAQYQGSPAPRKSQDRASSYTYAKVRPVPSTMASSPPVELYTSPSELDMSSRVSELQEQG